MKKFESEQNTLFSVILGHTLNVILGFIPRIYAKHSSVDTRVTPEYDRDLMVDSRDRLFVTPEYDNRKNFTKGLDVVRQCAGILERLKTHIKIHPLFCHPRAWLLARPEDLDSRVKPENDHKVMQCGRSMIEMLGVLAIIGVLSVGGIAGYTKAMERIKINKTLSTYNTLMFGFFQHIDDIRKISDDDVSSPYAFSDLLVALELVPPSWRRGGKWLADDFGNRIRIYPNYIEILFENYTMSKSKQISFCREFFYTLAKGYHNELHAAYIWRQGKNTEIFYYGSKFCGNTLPCLRNMTYDDVNNQCQLCGKDNNKSCSLVLYY